MTTELIKWLAVALMILEHTVRVVSPHAAWLAVGVGRFAFIVFAAVAGYNAWNRSSDLARYVGRLAAVGVLSWPLTYLLWGASSANVLITLALGVCWLHACRSLGMPRWSALVACVALAVLVDERSGPLIEFGFLGAAAVIAGSYLPRTDAWVGVIVLVASANVVHQPAPVAVWLVMCCAVMGAFAVVLSRWRCEVPRLPAWVWYAVYPSHVALLLLLRGATS